jgi:hypothetical protein
VPKSQENCERQGLLRKPLDFGTVPGNALAHRRRLLVVVKGPVQSVVSRVALCGLLLLALPVLGCTHQYISNTEVDDTQFNRSVIDYCESYRHAVEQRNIARLLKMAHPSYYEDGGNVDASDDLDYGGLKAYLESQFSQTLAIRYEIHYRNVSEGRKNTILVDYTYSASYKLPTPTHGELWRRRVADNRLELIRDGESFKILSGM